MYCLICQLPIEHEAISVWGESICSHCEQRLTELVVGHKDYERIIAVFRCLWQEHFFAEQNHRLRESERI